MIRSVKVKTDKLIRIWYKSIDQSADNPDPTNMYRCVEFKDPMDAIEWHSLNKRSITDVKVTKGTVEFVVDLKGK
jgi:hypothetical protein